LQNVGGGFAGAGLASLLLKDGRAAIPDAAAPARTHFAPRAKNVIYLHMVGAPSQLELFEPKPELNRLSGQVVPQSFTQGKRFAFIKGDAKLPGYRPRSQKAGHVRKDIS